MSDENCWNCMEEMELCECGETEGYSKDGAVCQYCGHLCDPSDSDGGLYDESMKTWECGSCGKEFNCDLYVSYSWTTSRIENH